jgi:hypothetical protein
MKLTKKLSIATAGVVLGLAGVSIPSSAQAAQLFNFNYSFGGSTPVSASGTLNTTDLNAGNNSYTITGITGTRTFNGVTQNILSLIAPGGFGANDNLLFANAPFLDSNGFTFKVNGAGNNGNGDVNVYYVGGYREYLSTAGSGAFNVTNVTPQPVPEPLTIASSVAAGAGLISARLKQRNKQKASQTA